MQKKMCNSDQIKKVVQPASRKNGYTRSRTAVVQYSKLILLHKRGSVCINSVRKICFTRKKNEKDE